MKKVFCVIMATLFLLVVSQQAVVVVHFKLNQQAIEKAFCINQGQPELECHGKCHLKKQLEHTDNKDWELSGIGKKIELVLNTDFDFLPQPKKQIAIQKIAVFIAFDYCEPILEIRLPPPVYVSDMDPNRQSNT